MKCFYPPTLGRTTMVGLCLTFVLTGLAHGQSTANTPMSTTASPTFSRSTNQPPANKSTNQPPAQSPTPTTFDTQLRSARPKAIGIILNASRSDRAELRANALEAIQPLPKRALPLAQRLIDDQNPGVRYSALITIGKLGLRQLGPPAARYLDDANASVRAAAIFAVHESGRQVNMNELPALLGSTNPQTRANTAMILGMMGEPSAVKMLRDRAKVPMPRASAVRKSLIDLQVAEAIVKLGDDDGLGPIRAAAYSTQYEVRVMAALTLGRLKDHRMASALSRMLDDQPIELELAAAQALAQMGDNRGKDIMLTGAAFDAKDVTEQTRQFLDQHPDSSFAPEHRGLLHNATARRRVAADARAQAAFALSQVHSLQAARALTSLLNDHTPHVRLSAAAATLQALTPPASP